MLDLGTGDGWPGLPLARCLREVVALDPSPRRADLAQDNAQRLGLTNVEVVCAPAGDLPFPAGSFDGVVSTTAIEQGTDPLAALREAFRVLQPGGRFAATFEDLSTELRGPVEETAELYLAGEVAVYRLVHRSLEPLREAKYELRFRASPALRQAAEAVRPVPTFRSTLGEAGLRSVSPEDSVLGIPILEAARGELLSGRFFELTHRTPHETVALVGRAGFTDVTAYGNIACLAREFFLPLYREGLLAKLVPYKDEITQVFGRLYGSVPVGGAVFSLVAKTP